MKITIIYIYFVIFLLLINSQDAVFISQRDSFMDAVNSYFLCEAVGYVPGRCSRETLEQYSHLLMKIVRHIMHIFLPTILLLYLINCRNLKANVKEMKVIKVLRSVSSRGPTTSSKSISTSRPNFYA